ncbi:unnamed protein product [Laminaria digitata]
MTLPVGIFDGLEALSKLGLSRNNLTTLPARVFDHLGKRTTLLTKQVAPWCSGLFPPC